LLADMLAELRVVNKHSKQKSVQFELRAPERDATCPISQDLIAESDLEFLEGVTLLKDFPELRAMKIACGHEFSAMCLVYHWARSGNIKCPVCRAGATGARLNLLRLPEHFRVPMCKRVRAERRKDAAEQRRADEEAARRMGLSSIQTISIELLPETVSLAVSKLCPNPEERRIYNMYCNFMVTHDGLLLSSQIPSNILRELGEFYVYGFFRTGFVETRFSESEAMTFDQNTMHTSSSVGNGHTRMIYCIQTGHDGDAAIHWRVGCTHFAQLSELHGLKLAMAGML
jgi:hypothetical protein